MDNSTNIIDLEYLVNPCYTIKIPEKIINEIYTVNQDELNFYKRRIFQLSRELLLGKKMNTKINDSFHNFARVCIEHFKFIDKADIIQQDYNKFSNKKKNRGNYFNMDKTDFELLKKKPAQQDISILLKIKKKTKPIFMPKQRNINLRNENLKTKGLIKKNLTNIHDEKKKKQKTKEKKKKTKKDNEGRKKKKKKCVKVEIR
jgi:hypothetical protein